MSIKLCNNCHPKKPTKETAATDVNIQNEY